MLVVSRALPPAEAGGNPGSALTAELSYFPPPTPPSTRPHAAAAAPARPFYPSSRRRYRSLCCFPRVYRCLSRVLFPSFGTCCHWRSLLTPAFCCASHIFSGGKFVSVPKKKTRREKKPERFFFTGKLVFVSTKIPRAKRKKQNLLFSVGIFLVSVPDKTKSVAETKSILETNEKRMCFRFLRSR